MPPGTQLTMQESIDRIENVTEQDLIVWFTNFFNISKLCGWNETTQFATVRALISIELQPKINQCETVSDIQYTLLRLKYPLVDAFRYTTELAEIKQEFYPRICDYYNVLVEKITILGCCKIWNQSQINAKIEEIFYQNLSPCTQIELARQGIYNIQDAIRTINQTEEVLIKTYKPENTKFINNTEFKHKREYENRTKWCSYHKVNSHNTEECRSKQETQNKERVNKTFSLIDNKPRIGVMKLEVSVNNINAVAILDSGSSYSYIPESQINEMNLKTETCSNMQSETADGRTIEVNKLTNADLVFKEIPNAKYKLKAYVLPTTGSDLILGSDFLTSNYAILNYAVPLISIDGHEIEILPSEQIDIHSPDIRICDRTKILKIESETNNELKNIINETKHKNPKIGTIHGIFHEIIIKSHNPIQCHEYPIPQKLRKKTLDELQRLVTEKIIRPSNSRYASPAYPILKRNNDIRLVVDYRKLNSITSKEIFPIQGIAEQLLDLQGSKYYSTIDLKSGYYQILMHPDSIHLTAFVIAGRQYEFLRMPFGLANAPRTFQRIMTQIFSEFKFVRIYLDDILIFSSSLEEHIDHVKQVIERLVKGNISINFEKSLFAKTEVKYLGQLINSEGIRADINRVNIELINKIPKTKKQLMSLIGYINWFRNYIPNLSSIISNITGKLKTSSAIEWTDRDTQTIQDIFNSIKANILLNFPDYKKPFELYCDACENGLGAMLKQGSKIIGLFSRKLTLQQTKYNIMEKEMLAIIFALEHFKPLVFGYSIDVYTDNLNNTFQEKINSRRCQRWQILIQEFNINLKFVEGKNNEIADFNSRIYLNKEIVPQNTESTLSNEDLTKIPMPSEIEIKNFFLTKDKYYKDKKGRIFITESYIKNFIGRLHHKLGHPGHQKLKNTLSNDFTSKNFNLAIKKISSTCILCQKNKESAIKYGKTSGFISPTKSLEIISSDIIGPFNYKDYKTTFTKNFFFITITDHFSRFTKVFASQNITSSEIINVLINWCSQFQKPKILVTDQGRQYMANETKTFLRKNGIDHNYTSAYNPTGNAVSERVNGSINIIMRICKNATIEYILKIIHARLNNTWHRILNTTPNIVLTGHSNLTPNFKKITISTDQIENKNKNQQLKNQQEVNSKRKEVNYEINNFVLLKNQNPKKTENRFSGPYIIKGTSKNTLDIENERQELRVNKKNVKPFLMEGEDVGIRQFKGNLVDSFDTNDNLTGKLKSNQEKHKSVIDNGLCHNTSAPTTHEHAKTKSRDNQVTTMGTTSSPVPTTS
ncbi:MAG: reverse transcriptase domain-containing protein [Aeromonas sp.]